jgi:para-aminobenzoate synthetase/4-amino-4-deoxychorismate lyase
VPSLDWQPTVTASAYRAAVERIKTHIHDGDTYQVNYTYRLRAPFVGDPWAAFARLAAAQETPYAACVDTGDWVLASASPELFFTLEGQAIASKPMKGTAARGVTQAEDLAQAAALKNSEKDRAENVMIVDMVRNDLGRVAIAGSVHVPRLFDVERYPTVWQMTSTVAARTTAGLAELFGALFPPASITGAPKVETMRLITGLEAGPRGVYTGTIGFVAPGPRMQFNVAIRTMAVDRRRGQAEYGVGSGIVWDSDPGREWAECETKSRVLTAVMPEFRLLETLKWMPPEGFALLERHLRRLTESAQYFGFPVDVVRVRDALERAASGWGGESRRVRLLVPRGGEPGVESVLLPAPVVGRPRVAVAQVPVDVADRFLYHKTTHRRVYEEARAAHPDVDDVLLVNACGELTESTIANLAVELDGRLCTPPVDCGLLAGTLRAELLERGELTERVLMRGDLRRSRRVCLLNSVRGMWEVEVV